MNSAPVPPELEMHIEGKEAAEKVFPSSVRKELVPPGFDEPEKMWQREWGKSWTAMCVMSRCRKKFSYALLTITASSSSERTHRIVYNIP